MSVTLWAFSLNPEVQVVIHAHSLRLAPQPFVIASFVPRLHLVESVLRLPHGLFEPSLLFPFEVLLGFFFGYHGFGCKMSRWFKGHELDRSNIGGGIPLAIVRMDQHVCA